MQRSDPRIRQLYAVEKEARGRVAAVAYTLIETAKPNGITPQIWLADTIAPHSRL